jgi:drug/metabolite transporter (DMT)-like permease
MGSGWHLCARDSPVGGEGPGRVGMYVVLVAGVGGGAWAGILGVCCWAVENTVADSLSTSAGPASGVVIMVVLSGSRRGSTISSPPSTGEGFSSNAAPEPSSLDRDAGGRLG